MKTVILLVLWICVVRSYIVHPGPKYVATKGYVWPKPLNQTSEDEFYSINPVQFEFEVGALNFCFCTTAYVTGGRNQLQPLK